MGKGKKKIKLAKKIHNIGDFKKFVCTNCGLCGEDSLPEFCYKDICLGTTNGLKRFINGCLPRLKKARNIAITSGKTPIDSIGENRFRLLFCNPDICDYAKDNCGSIVGCYKGFRLQLNGDPRLETFYAAFNGDQKNLNEPKKWKKKGKNKVVTPSPEVERVPTFIVSKGLKEEVKDIINAFNNKKQVKVGRGT